MRMLPESSIRRSSLVAPRVVRSGLETRQLFSQTGFATFLVSVSPVIGSLNSLQLIGYIVLSVSLFAMITPSSFRAVVR